ncbi:DNA polymerase I [Candidatus Blochmannia ocreatus (nom. nud.)]|uniref:DNA polymerase I n=1 Tax=Candidatus Blochmannia ocreatus (nom. nud.) TaxID=251538 RepID=A0ABY4SZ20_9ENTR|nr:DNA polymerase I [Candidatus Blochmannia ocreatus]URJ25084.1 DNA polymerase I [Candidatus Blochmannia ocreatus]
MTIINIKNPIILVDGSYYAYRAYYAFPQLINSLGEPIWVIYGVLKMINSLLKKHKPIQMAVIFDTIGQKTFRKDLYAQYKANRPKTPINLSIQMNPLCQIIEAMGIKILKIPGIEADDIIGTLSVFFAQKSKKNHVLISTGDKDITQIISPQITIINSASNNIVTPAEIEKKFGIPPNLMADYLALIGDRSDNIPGIPKIGKKTAQILLNKIGNLKTIYEQLEKIDTLNLRNTKTIKNALKINKDALFLYYKLTTINTNILLKEADYQLSIKTANIDILLSLFKKYEFEKWLIDLKSGTWLIHKNYANNITLPTKFSENKLNLQKNKLLTNFYQEKTIKIIHDTDMLFNWIKKINVAKIFTFNLDTDNFNASTANIISISLSIDSKENAFIPIQTDYSKNYYNFLCLKKTLNILKPILENSKIKKIGQNLKFSHSIFKRYNIDLLGIEFDVILELYVLYGTANFKNIKNFLDINTFNAILNFKENYNFYEKNKKTLDLGNVQLRSIHSIQLTQSMSKLHNILWIKISENPKLKEIFKTIEIPLITVLSRIENYGVLIDKQLLHNHSEELNSKINTLKLTAYKLIGTPFNLASTKQLQEILYNKQKLPILKKTPHGSPSTNEEVLKILAKKYPIPKIILQYRSLSKLKSTYTNKLTDVINKHSNRVHTSYNQTRTSTGRLSSNNPNLQNIPNRNYEGRKIRQAFIAPKNFLIIAADYSQIELRIMAHLSKDIKLIHDFLSEKDIHTLTAAEIFVTTLQSVTNEQRHKAKTINFGLIYGMSAFGLAQQLSVTRKEAQQYVDRYFKRYPGIMKYMQYIREHVKKYGYVYTLNGRKLYLPNIYSNNISQKRSAERAAINAPMQGSAADIIKKAMISIDNWLQTDDIPARIIMQVHDELVFEVQNSIVDFFTKKIKKLMEECYVLKVPLRVDIGIGKNWEQAH